MGDFEAKNRTFALSLVAAYSSNLDYFHHVLNVLGSYTGDCPQTLHTMGANLFQQNPALLEQFFCLFPWARHPEDQGLKNQQSVKHSEDEGLNVDKISPLKNISSKNLNVKMSDVLLCSTVNANIVSESTCGNRSDIKIDSTSGIKIDNSSKTDRPLRRSSRVVAVPLGGYNNDLPEEVLLQVKQLKPQLQTPEMSDSSDEFEGDYNFDKSYERENMESENDHSFESQNDQSKNAKSQTETDAERTCPECLKIFKERKYMKRHCKEYDCKEMRSKFSCPKCKKIFKKWRYLKQHARLIDCQETERISCPKCLSQFKAKKYLREHIRLQKCRPTSTVMPFQCPKCNKKFGKEGHLRQHKNTSVKCHEKTTPSIKLQKCDRPSSSGQFQCPKCNRSFNNKGHLTQHTNKKVKCDTVKKLAGKPKTCKTSHFWLEINTVTLTVGEEYVSQEIVTKKQRNDEFGKERKSERQDENSTKKCVKLSENEFQCPQCKMVFATIRKLRWHRMKVHDSDPCICHYCSKTFSTKETLSKHVCKIDPLLIKCDVCDTSFEGALELSVHLGTVHDRVCCSHCTRNFANPQDLLEHYELVHQKTFTCDQCNSSFRQKSQLLDHIRQVHLKLWLFPCLECKKEGISIGFKRKTYWNTHMKKHHSQIDTEECFDESFREAFLGKMAEERGSRIDTLETNWENIREADWVE